MITQEQQRSQYQYGVVLHGCKGSRPSEFDPTKQVASIVVSILGRDITVWGEPQTLKQCHRNCDVVLEKVGKYWRVATDGKGSVLRRMPESSPQLPACQSVERSERAIDAEFPAGVVVEVTDREWDDQFNLGQKRTWRKVKTEQGVHQVYGSTQLIGHLIEGDRVMLKRSKAGNWVFAKDGPNTIHWSRPESAAPSEVESVDTEARSQPKMAEVKQEVFEALSVSSSAELRRKHPRMVDGLDLRRKSSWLSVLEAIEMGQDFNPYKGDVAQAAFGPGIESVPQAIAIETQVLADIFRQCLESARRSLGHITDERTVTGFAYTVFEGVRSRHSVDDLVVAASKQAKADLGF